MMNRYENLYNFLKYFFKITFCIQNFASKFLYLGSNNLPIFCKINVMTIA